MVAFRQNFLKQKRTRAANVLEFINQYIFIRQPQTIPDDWRCFNDHVTEVKQAFLMIVFFIAFKNRLENLYERLESINVNASFMPTGN